MAVADERVRHDVAEEILLPADFAKQRDERVLPLAVRKPVPLVHQEVRSAPRAHVQPVKPAPERIAQRLQLDADGRNGHASVRRHHGHVGKPALDGKTAEQRRLVGNPKPPAVVLQPGSKIAQVERKDAAVGRLFRAGCRRSQAEKQRRDDG